MSNPKTRLKLSYNPVHDHFTFDKVANKSQCKSCPSSLRGKNPSSLANHLKARHPSIYKVFVANKSRAQKLKVDDNDKKMKAKAVFTTPATLNESGSSGVSVKDLIGGSRNSSLKFSHGDPRQKKINRKLAVTIATSSLPVNIVSNPAFKEFVAELNPSARVPAKDKMRKEVNEIWKEVKENIDKALKVARRVSITTDIWSTKGCNSSYLGVTVHFYNSETKCRGANKIACREFPVRHNAVNIAELILKICKEYSIDCKLTHMVIDNGSNMVKAVREFNNQNRRGANDEEDSSDNEEEEEDLDDEMSDSSDEEERDVDENEEAESVEREAITEVEEHDERDRMIDNVLKNKKVRRGGCFSHTMQCAINCVAKSRHLKFGKVMKKTKKYVNKYKKSTIAKEVLRATSFKKRLVGFVKTRWFSDLAMCKSIIEAFELSDKPLSVLTEKMGWNCEITVQDIRTLKLFCEILDPFAKHTDILGGENYSTIQLVYPTLVDLLAHVDEMSLKPGMRRFCEGLIKEIKKYFAFVLEPESVRYDATCIAATFLDPCWTAILDEEQIAIAKNHLFELCKEYSENNSDIIDAVSVNAPPPLAFANYKHVSRKISGTVGSAGSLTALFRSDLETYVKECDRIRLEIQNESKKTVDTPEEEADSVEVIEELDDGMDLYDNGDHENNVDDRNEEDDVAADDAREEVLMRDPLDYWVAEETRYYSPIARVAQDLLTIPATSTPSERLFSASGLLTEGKMASISPENLEKRVLIKVNISKQ